MQLILQDPRMWGPWVSSLSHPAELYTNGFTQRKDKATPEVELPGRTCSGAACPNAHLTCQHPGASSTLMSLGTFTVPVFKVGIKLATSPSNILLACQRNTGGGEGRAGIGCSVWMCFLQHHNRALCRLNRTGNTAFQYSRLYLLKLHRN